jgi:predicted RNase H-like HicB family nuclease
MGRLFKAVIERDGESFIAHCPEVPGANGQGHDPNEALASLREAIDLILDDRPADDLPDVPDP